MRNAVRIVVLAFLGLLSTAVIGVSMAFMSAVSLAATTVLLVPGTGTPDANVVDDYMPNFWDRYIAGTDPALPAECTTATDCTLKGINYPASFFPLAIIPGWCEPNRCETWNDSVGLGVTNLNSQLIEQLADSDDDVFLAGYSQGGAVVSDELRNLADLDPALKERLKVFMIGNAYNPDGGIFTRLGFLPTIPFLDVTFGPATPVDTGIPITGVGFEFDPVMYAPTFWGNGLAVLNAFAAFDTVHGFYLTPNGNGPTDQIAYGYTEDELADILATACPGPHCRVDSFGNKYYMIPAESLPMFDLLTSMVPAPLAPFVQPIVELVSPAAEVLINLGYDWSGDPGKTRWLSPLPFSLNTNFVQVGVDLVEAVGQGIENAFGGGATTMIAPEDESADEGSAVSSESNVAAFSARAVGEDESTDDLLTTTVGDDDATSGDDDADVTIDSDDEVTVKDNDATIDSDDDAAVNEDDDTKVDSDNDTTGNENAIVDDDETADVDATDDKQDDAAKGDDTATADKQDADNQKAA